MTANREQEGRDFAAALVKRLKGSESNAPAPVIEMDAIVSALDNIARSRVDLAPVVKALMAIEPAQQEAPDFTPVVRAIQALTLDVDLTAITKAIHAAASQPIDLGPVVRKIDALAAVVARNTDTLAQLIDVVKSPKSVTYDATGRITEIKVNG